jgi:hypothetical protein
MPLIANSNWKKKNRENNQEDLQRGSSFLRLCTPLMVINKIKEITERG